MCFLTGTHPHLSAVDLCFQDFSFCFVFVWLLFFLFFFSLLAISETEQKSFSQNISCLLACSRPSAVSRSISQTDPRRAAVTAGWETRSRAARPAPPCLFPSASLRRSTTSKHRLTAALRETETQTPNLVSTEFFALLQTAGKYLIYEFHCYCFFLGDFQRLTFP